MCSAPKSAMRQIRQVDSTFVKVLKKRMLEDAAAPGVAPLAVLCTDVQHTEQFRAHLKDHYHYEVLGGLHTMTGKKELSEEVPGEYLSVVLSRSTVSTYFLM